MHLIILGAGGYGRTVADVAGQTGQFDEIAFLDDNSAAPDAVSYTHLNQYSCRILQTASHAFA